MLSSRTSRRPRLLAALVGAFAIVAATLSPISAAADPAPGSISGTVTAADGPVADVYIYVFAVGSYDQVGMGHVSTDAAGNYVFPDIPAGDYQVGFEPSTEGHTLEWWNDKPDRDGSDVVTVGDGQGVAGIDAFLAPAPYTKGTVSGSVTDANGPVAGAYVAARPMGSANPSNFGNSTTTDAAGEYSIPDLLAGDYRLEFHGPSTAWVTEYYDDETYENATPVNVVGGSTTSGIDAVLAVATTGSIRGSLHGDGPNNTALRGAEVDITNVAGTFQRTEHTDQNGTFWARDLAPDEYLVEFALGGNYQTEWWADADSTATATPVHLVAGDTVELPATVSMIDSTPGTISGTIYNFGNPNVGIPGYVYWRNVGDSNNASSTVATDENGNFTLTLQPDDYVIEFQTTLGDEWWENESEATATVISLAPGQAVTGIEPVLNVPNGSISGSVTGAPDVPLQAYVTIQDVATGEHATLPTAPDGSYSFPNLPHDRDYLLYFSTDNPDDPNDSTYPWVPEWWQDATSEATALPIYVHGGEDISGVDAVLTSQLPPPGGSISGHVISDDHPEGLAGQLVQVSNNGDYYSATTDASGDYSVSGLPDGAYQVVFIGADRYVPQWWPYAQYSTGAQPVNISSSEAVNDVDAEMETGGSVSGHLTSSAGGPASGVTVYLELPSGRPVSAGSTDASGNYRIPMVAPGPYAVHFAGYSGSDYVQQWWSNKSTLATSQLIAVDAGQETGSIDAVLQVGASISGTVRGGAGERLYWVTVKAYDSTGALVDTFFADSSGNYRVNGLKPGAYTLQFLDGDGAGWAPQWWSNKPTRLGSTAITVTAGQQRSGFDVTLAQGASIAGTVTYSGAAPTGLTVVDVLDAAGTVVAETSVNSSQPTYRLAALPPGTYTVRFGGEESNYETQWWNGGQTRASATTITLATGQAVSGIDATLNEGGSITGNFFGSSRIVLSHVLVTATSLDGEFSEKTYLRDDGSFTITGLNAGTYHLYVSNGFGESLDEWYDHTNFESMALPVTVAAGQSTSMGFGGLSLGRAVYGSIVGGTRYVQVPGATISVFDQQGRLLREGTSGPYGDFEIKGLGVEPQYVRFSAPGYLTVWAGGGSNFLTAAPVVADANGLPVNLGTIQLTDAAPLTAAPTPTVIGTRMVGQMLTANTGTWKPAPVALAYQWNREGVPIIGATASTYGLTAEDAGWHITVTVTGTKDGYVSQSKTSALGAVVTGGVFTLTPTPTVSGVGAVGRVLTADPGVWGPGSPTLSYRWYRDGVAISGATASTYKLLTADAGTAVTVTVTGSQPGYTSVARTSQPTPVELRLSTTPTPGISGTLAVGQSLTATSTAWGPAPVDLEYQWARNGTPIVGATDLTYELVTEDAGTQLTVSITGSKPGYTSVVKTSAARLIQSLLDPAPQPAIVGTPAVGQVLTAQAGSWTPDPVTLRYQWKRNGTTNIGSNSPNYALVTADAGATITVSVTGSKTGFTSVTTTSDLVQVEQRFTTTPTPAITGTLRVGQVLAAVTGAWAPTPDAFDYEWKRNGVPIAAALDPTYELQVEDAGASITVTVTASRYGFTSIARTSTAKAIERLLVDTPTPVITGTPAVRQVLTVGPGAWTPAPVTLRYQWKRNGTTNIGSNSPTYTLVAADAGAQITVTVTGSKAAYTPVSVTSDATTIEGALTVGTPSITGTLDVGQVLTALPGTWGPAPVDFAYQWNRAGLPIDGANDATYELVAADAGALITVAVTGSKDDFTTKSKTSAAKTIRSLLTATPQPAITGTPTVGQTLSVTAGAWSPAPVTLSYRWFRNGTQVGTAATYRLVAADSGQLITVTITGAKSGYTSASSTSSALHIN